MCEEANMSTLITTETGLRALSPEEISKARNYLVATRDQLLNAIDGLSPAQWTFKEAPDRWSIAEIVEHIVIVEGFVHVRVRDSCTAEPAGTERDDGAIDALILEAVPKVVQKLQAPPRILPSGDWDLVEAARRFTENRSVTLDLLATAPCLRGRVQPHPILGPLDGYQWILAGTAHCARHLSQIANVKADPRYPS
jgi:hypothetical protein